MKEKIIESVGDKLDKLDIFISDVKLIDDDEKTLEIEFDRSGEEYIDLNTVVMATRIINPIIDKLDLIDGSYTLDCYAKERGEQNG